MHRELIGCERRGRGGGESSTAKGGCGDQEPQRVSESARGSPARPGNSLRKHPPHTCPASLTPGPHAPLSARSLIAAEYQARRLIAPRSVLPELEGRPDPYPRAGGAQNGCFLWGVRAGSRTRAWALAPYPTG
eukprot:221960-Rhodomonas_salina.1